MSKSKFRRNSLQRLCLALVLTSASITPSTSDAKASAQQAETKKLSLESLLQEFATCPGLEANYTEQRDITLLTVPLMSDGKVFFSRPNLLARQTFSPEKTTVILNGDKLTFIDPTGRQDLDLSERPVLRSFASSFSQVLSGDLESLRKTYSIEFETKPSTDSKTNSAQQWSMQLTPRPEALARILTSLRIEGQGIEVRTMILREKTGDSTTTHFSNVNTKRTYSQEEQQSLFSPPAP